MKLNKIFRSVTQVMWFLAFTAAMGVILNFFYYSTSKNVISGTEKTAMISVQVTEEFLSENMNLITLESESVSKMISDGAGREEILRFLTDTTDGYINSYNDDFTGFYGCLSGEYIDGSGWTPEDDYVCEDRPWYISAAGSPGETVISEPYTDAQTGKIMLSVSRMSPDAMHVIAMDIELQRLSDFVSDIGSDNNTSCIILDSSGVAAASSLRDEGKNYLSGSSDEKILAENVMNSGSGHFKMKFRGKNSIVFYAGIQQGWHSVIIMNSLSLFINTYINMIIFAVIANVAVLYVFYYINASEQKRKEAEKSLSQAVAVSSIYVSVNEINLKDKSYDLIYSYDHVRNVLGSGNYTASEGINKVMKALVTENYVADVLDFVNLETIAERLGSLKTITMEFVGKRLGWCRARFIVESYDSQNRPYLLLFAVEDINQAKINEEKLRSQSTVDNLTGCLNRRAFDEKIIYYRDHPMENDLVYISADVNGLKAVNDDLGHAAGDELIAGAALCLKSVLNRYGSVYRTGGDEFFAIINADTETTDSALLEVQKLCDEWSGKYIEGVSVSAGYAAHCDFPDMTISELAKTADQNMYDAKSRYYMKKGIDRRGQQDAYAAICSSYEKIILINLTDDSFRTVSVKQQEMSEESGFCERHSLWSSRIAASGIIYEDDREEYLKIMDLEFLRGYFRENRILSFRYRRRIDGRYRNVLTEIVRSDKYTEEDQFIYLYVKNIDSESEQTVL